MNIETVFKFAVEFGLFPVLFIFAFFYIINEAKNREKAQGDLYKSMAGDVKEIKDSILTLENEMKRIDANVSNIATSTSNLSANASKDSGNINVLQEISHLKIMVTTMETNIQNKLNNSGSHGK